MTEHVTTAVDGPILTPDTQPADKKNALTNAMYGALADGLQHAHDDKAIRCVLLRSSSDCFTAGNDLGDFAAISAGAGPADGTSIAFCMVSPPPTNRSSPPCTASPSASAPPCCCTAMLSASPSRHG